MRGEEGEQSLFPGSRPPQADRLFAQAQVRAKYQYKMSGSFRNSVGQILRLNFRNCYWLTWDLQITPSIALSGFVNGQLQLAVGPEQAIVTVRFRAQGGK